MQAELSAEAYGRACAQSLMKLANKRGNEVGPEIVDEVESESINVVSNTQLKVRVYTGQPEDAHAGLPLVS